LLGDVGLASEGIEIGKALVDLFQADGDSVAVEGRTAPKTDGVANWTPSGCV